MNPLLMVAAAIIAVVFVPIGISVVGEVINLRTVSVRRKIVRYSLGFPAIIIGCMAAVTVSLALFESH